MENSSNTAICNSTGYMLSRLMLAILLAASTAFRVRGQEVGFKLVREIPLKGVSVLNVDRFGNLYTAMKDGSVVQRDSLGKTTYSFFPEFVALPTQIESNLLVRTGIFYQELQRMVWLTRRMALIEETDLVNFNVGFVTAMSVAADGSVWVWDNVNRVLKKVWLNNRQTQQEIPLALELPKEANVLKLHSHQHFLMVGIASEGVWVINERGEIVRKIQFSLSERFQVVNNLIVHSSENVLHFTNWKEPAQKAVSPLPKKTSEWFVIKEQYLYLYADQTIVVYRWSLGSK